MLSSSNHLNIYTFTFYVILNFKDLQIFKGVNVNVVKIMGVIYVLFISRRLEF